MGHLRVGPSLPWKLTPRPALSRFQTFWAGPQKKENWGISNLAKEGLLFRNWTGKFQSVTLYPFKSKRSENPWGNLWRAIKNVTGYARLIDLLT